MKSLEELKAIRDKMKGQIGMRSESMQMIHVLLSAWLPVESQAVRVRF